MEIKPNNILLVGNGFDLAHGLLTSYDDFYFLMQKWNIFYAKYLEKEHAKSQDYEKNGQVYLENYDRLTDKDKERILGLLGLSYKMNHDNIKKLGEIIKTNSWAQYYQKCGAEIDGWIDFEREMYPVLDLFEEIFRAAGYVIKGPEGYAFRINDAYIDENLHRIVSLLQKYFKKRGEEISINESYMSRQYGILKKTIMNSLKEELNDFIKALELYLHEFVYNKTDVKMLKQIRDISADYVISFNYTLTEQLYDISEDKAHHIHGAIRENLDTGINNMVLGVNERENQNIDFIYFVKYFQRIQKKCGTQYKQFINDKAKETESFGLGYLIDKPYNLHIYGHSLDVTDEDILKYVIGDYSENRKFELKPKQVIIYYYDQVDFESKVINLINLYGRAVVEEYMENDSFHFEKTRNEAV